MLLINRLNGINAQINVYLEEIAALQTKVSQLQSHAQEVQGAEQAAESALTQIDTALAMLQAICPDEIATFKAAIDAKFNGSVPQLRAALDPDPEPKAPIQGNPVEDDSETIEATAIAADDDTETDDSETDDSETEVSVDYSTTDDIDTLSS